MVIFSSTWCVMDGRGKKRKKEERGCDGTAKTKIIRFAPPLKPSESQEEEIFPPQVVPVTVREGEESPEDSLKDSLDILTPNSPQNPSAHDVRYGERDSSFDKTDSATTTTSDTRRSYSSTLKNNKKYHFHKFRDGIQEKRIHRRHPYRAEEYRSMDASSYNHSVAEVHDSTGVFDYPDSPGTSSSYKEELVEDLSESVELFNQTSTLSSEKRATNAQVLGIVSKAKEELQQMKERYAIMFAAEVTSLPGTIKRKDKENKRDISIFLTGSEE